MTHEKTIESIKNIEHNLKIIKNKQDSVNATIKEIVEKYPDTMYSLEYRDNLISEVKKELESVANTYQEPLHEHASTILETEAELSMSPIDLNDTAFSTAVQLITTLGKDLPIEQQKDIARQFKGNYPAENYLAELYNNLAFHHQIQKTNYTELYRELTRSIATFNSQSEKTASGYRRIEKALNNILDAINSDYKVDLGISEDAFIESVMNGAGLRSIK